MKHRHTFSGKNDSLRTILFMNAANCTDCGACARHCSFLKQYGVPGQIARDLLSGQISKRMAFECSLCGLCDSVCPAHLSLANMFLATRRQGIETGEVSLNPYRAILGYEKRGHSRLFSFHGIPDQCDTVFFPGCTLPGTRPKTTWAFFQYLSQYIENLGVVLDCCHKPSHDLGRQGYFKQKFGEIVDHLKGKGVRRVVVACPNCHKVFRIYGRGLEVVTAYELIRTLGVVGSSSTPLDMNVTIHDPCPLREEPAIHDSVRTIAGHMGVRIKERRNREKQTFCCGEGGSVPFVKPEFAMNWARKSTEQGKGNTILTYCAGCAGFLSKHNNAIHLLDIVFFPKAVRTGTFKTTRPPFTYMQRLLLKRKFKKRLEG